MMNDVEVEAREALERWARSTGLSMAPGLVAVDLSRLGRSYKGLVMGWKWRKSRPNDVYYRVESRDGHGIWNEAKTPDAALALYDMDTAMRTASASDAKNDNDTEKVASTDADWKRLAEGLQRGLKRLSLPDVETIRVRTKPNWKMSGKIGGVRFSVNGDMTPGGAYDFHAEMAGRKVRFQAWNLFDASEKLGIMVADLYRSAVISSNRIPASNRAASSIDKAASRVASRFLSAARSSEVD